jgi:hypothetical protein
LRWRFPSKLPATGGAEGDSAFLPFAGEQSRNRQAEQLGPIASDLDARRNSHRHIRSEQAAISVRGIQRIDTAIRAFVYGSRPRMAEAHRSPVAELESAQRQPRTADQYAMSGRKFTRRCTIRRSRPSLVGIRFQDSDLPFMQLGTSVDHRFGGGKSGFSAFSMTRSQFKAIPPPMRSP